ncbi:MAG: class I SAM-dependent methyltransferase [Pseudomonadota bacterium]
MNAELLPPSGFDLTALRAEQGFRPTHRALENAGLVVAPEIDLASGKAWDTVLVLAHRNRLVNQRNLTRAWNALKPGGQVVFCGAKTHGVQPLRKWAQKRTDLSGSLSKHHAIVFWLTKQGTNWPLEDYPPADHGYRVAPGMFSAKGPDTGSQVLVPHLADKLKGHGADFGAGWGFLSDQALRTNSLIAGIDLFEADHASLDAARHNISPVEGLTLNFHWCDMAAEQPKGRHYDWIIMNPPFHTGRAAEPALGNTFIEAASRTLRPGGRLFMVANINLPYEAALERGFRKAERIDQAKGFKVFEAIR